MKLEIQIIKTLNIKEEILKQDFSNLVYDLLSYHTDLSEDLVDTLFEERNSEDLSRIKKEILQKLLTLI